MLDYIRDREPHATGQLVGAALTFLVAAGLDIPVAMQTAVAGLVVAAVIWVGRRHVTPEARAVERETVAAGEAALRTAIDLSNKAAGVAGEVTEEALEVVGDVVDEVTGTEEEER